MDKHDIIITEKDGQVTVQMSASKWREYEQARETVQVAHRITKALKQCEAAQDMSRAEVMKFIDSLNTNN